MACSAFVWWAAAAPTPPHSRTVICTTWIFILCLLVGRRARPSQSLVPASHPTPPRPRSTGGQGGRRRVGQAMRVCDIHRMHVGPASPACCKAHTLPGLTALLNFVATGAAIQLYSYTSSTEAGQPRAQRAWRAATAQAARHVSLASPTCGPSASRSGPCTSRAGPGARLAGVAAYRPRCACVRACLLLGAAADPTPA